MDRENLVLPKAYLSEAQELPPLLLSGIDSLYVSYYLDGLGIDWEELAYEKQKLRQDRRRDFAEIAVGGETWALMPYGQYPYALILANEDYRVQHAEKNRPNCYVQFARKAIWTKGLEHLTAWLNAWFARLGATVTRPEVISRVDFAFDFHIPKIDFTSDWFVTRATKDSCWRDHGTVQTFQIGRDAVVVRVYDKLAEIKQQSGKYWFYELWGRKENIWRVEFQVRRARPSN